MKIPKALLLKFREDPRVFFKFLKVFDKEQQQLLPFVLNDEQEILLDALLNFSIKEVIIIDTPPKPFPQTGFQYWCIHWQRGYTGPITWTDWRK